MSSFTQIIASDYNFQTQAQGTSAGPGQFAVSSPGGTMTGGTAVSITLAPVPPGINGSDTKHYLYVKGGVGAPEGVLIIGGSAIALATSGTITFIPANNHSGAWQISSATTGIAEAMQSLAPSGGEIYIPSGTYTIYKPVGYLPRMSFRGAGVTTILVPATSTTIVFDGNVPRKFPDEQHMISDNVRFEAFQIDGHNFNGVNGISGIQGLTPLTSPENDEAWHYFGIDIVGVYFNNIYNSILFQRSRFLNILSCKLYANSQITITEQDLRITPKYFSANTLINDLIYTWHAIDAVSCDEVSMDAAVITLVNTELTYISNSQFSLHGGIGPRPIGIAMAGGEDLSIVNCVFNTAYYAIFLGTYDVAGVHHFAGFVRISDVSIDDIYGSGIKIADGSSGVDSASNQVQHVAISNCFITDTRPSDFASFVSVGAYSRDISFSSNHFRDLVSGKNQVAVVIGKGCRSIRFDRSNSFINGVEVAGNSEIGIYIDPSEVAEVYGLEGLNFSNFGSTINDSAATVPSSSSLALPAGRKYVFVTGNTNITSISPVPETGTVLVVQFASALTVLKGNNLKLLSDFTSTTSSSSTLTLYSDGLNLLELSRAAT